MELLIVVVVLVVLAGGAMLSMDGVQGDASSQVARTEMLEIKNALLSFRADTGFLPRQGPFELALPAAPCIGIANGHALIPDGKNREWFCSPANFNSLYTNPLTGTGHALETWQPDTKRGFRGPYLTQHGEGLVDVGDNLQSNGAGSPIAGLLLSEMRGVADPFVGDPVGAYLVFRITPSATPHSRWGRPYFMFDLDDQGTADAKEARIVGMGPNGRYDGLGADLCAPPPASDDLVLCLFK